VQVCTPCFWEGESMWQHEPLRFPAGWPVGPKPSTFERVCMRIPLLGWIVASFCRVARWEPVRRELKLQFAARQPVPTDVWSESPQRGAVATCMAKWIEQWIGWPHDRLAPDDPLEILFWDPVDGLTANLLIKDVEGDLGIHLTAEELHELWKLETFSEAVDFFLQKGGGKPGEARQT